MQQKQQQNLLQRTTSISNNSTPQSDSTNKQQKSSSFWNHFGIGGSKQEDTSSNNAIDASAIPGTPPIATNDDPGRQMNGDTNGLNEMNSGMAPRYFDFQMNIHVFLHKCHDLIFRLRLIK